MKRQLGVPVLTDVHEYTPLDEVAAVVDVLQIAGLPVPPDRLHPRWRAPGRPVNIKKGQFLAPWDMQHVVEKARAPATRRSWSASAASASATTIWSPTCAACAVMRATGCPVVFDATHSRAAAGRAGRHAPAASASSSPVLARAAVAVGVDGVFMETHPIPTKALSDGPNAWPLPQMEALLETLLELDRIAKRSARWPKRRPSR